MKYILLSMTLLMNFSVLAEELDRGATPFNAEGTIMMTTQTREAPPHGLFNLFVGKKVADKKKSSKVKIIGKKTYGGFSGINTWYQIETINKSKTTQTRPLWIYGGIEGQAPKIIINEKMMEK